MKYYLKIKNRSVVYNASFKPSEDGYAIAEKKGYSAIEVSHWGNNKSISRAIAIWEIIKITLKIKSEDIIFIQYPMFTPLIKYLFRAISKRCKHIYILIHDLETLRNENVIKEHQILSSAEKLIVHNENMKKFIEDSLQPAGKIEILQLFDYLSSENQKNEYKVNEIVYAGNLANNTFLLGLSEVLTDPRSLLVYGKEENWMKEKEIKFSYKGKFLPNQINNVEGYWGLLWYGDSIYKCTGIMGNYMRYISPHKVSLYLATGKPIIISKDSALATYIEENKLGITANSLLEIEDRINALTEQELKLIQENVKKISTQLKSGAFLSKHL